MQTLFATNADNFILHAMQGLSDWCKIMFGMTKSWFFLFGCNLNLSLVCIQKWMKNLFSLKLWCSIVAKLKHENLVSNKLLRVKYHHKKTTKLTFQTTALHQCECSTSCIYITWQYFVSMAPFVTSLHLF